MTSTITPTIHSAYTQPHRQPAGERIMKLAEELYQSGFVSYPRWAIIPPWGTLRMGAGRGAGWEWRTRGHGCSLQHRVGVMFGV